MALKTLKKWLGDAIEDAGEETFLLFSQSLPSHNLGFVNGNASRVEVDIAGRSFELKQSPGLLNSKRSGGTTGAVLWEITPLIGEWLASLPHWLKDAEILHSGSTVVELGCGITGLLGLLVAPKVSNYLLTDQTYVMKTLRENLISNSSSTPPQAPHGKRTGADVTSNLKAIPLDWEVDSAAAILEDCSNTDHIDLVIVCDCVYNEHLIQPLVQTLVELCQVGSPRKPTSVIIAQQLRSNTVLEQFLENLLRNFVVWRVPDERLLPSLNSGSGYVVHLAQLKEDGASPESGRVTG